MQTNSEDGKGEMGKAFTTLLKIIRDGIKHGFFKCTVIADMIQGKKRRITIEAGKSYQFTVPEDELE